MFIEVDPKNWARYATFEFFKNYEDPFFNLTANVDVSALYRFSRTSELSFSLSALYCSLVAVNGIREFRIRLVGDQLVEYDRIHATQTILNDDETFSFAYFEFEKDIFEFNRWGRAAMERYKGLRTFDVESGRLDLIYYSVIPWVSFTSFKHASRLDKTETIPRIVFGKIFADGERQMMPVSVEANHAIMDGIHVGRFYQKFQEVLDSVENASV